jgi:hypothetical protein
MTTFGWFTLVIAHTFIALVDWLAIVIGSIVEYKCSLNVLSNIFFS